MTHPFRLIAGSVALAAGMWFLTLAATAAPPLSKEAYKAATAADISFLQRALNGGDPAKGAMPSIKGVAALVALYGEAVGDEALRSQALQVLEAAAKKDWKTADAAAKGLNAPKADPAAPKKSLDAILKDNKCGLEEVMSPFRLTKVGGLNIEKDIRDATKAGAKTNPKDAELIGVRAAAIGDYAVHFPVDKAKANKGKLDMWNKWCKDMVDTGKELTDEGAKGAKADGKKLETIFKKLDKSCTDCHNEFRN